MPRLVHVSPKYRTHSTGQAVVTLNGRDFYLGRAGTKESRIAYNALIQRWELNGRRLIDAVESDLTIVELCSRYLRFAQGYYRATDPKNQAVPGIKRAIRYLRLMHGRLPAKDFGPLALKAVRGKMIEDGLARSYINDHVGRIVRMFRWAVGEELVPVSVHQALSALDGLRRGRSAARETIPVLPVDDAIVNATLTHLPRVVADLVRLQRLTGCRPAELLIIRPCDVDRGDEVWKYRPTSHKTQYHGRERVIFIGTRAKAVLEPYLNRALEDYCFRPCDSELQRRAIVHSTRKTPLSEGNKPGTNRKRRPKKQPGDRYSVDSYRRAIQRAADKAGVGRWSPNQLRHSAATDIRRQFGLEAAQVYLGHSAANVTQIYAERDQALGTRVAAAIG